MAEEHSHIPVIDFKEYGPDKPERELTPDVLKTLGDQFKTAFETVGFCYIKNHGVDYALIEKHFSASREYFTMAKEEKQKQARSLENHEIFGWIASELERVNPERPGDLKEAFNYYPSEDTKDWPEKGRDFQESSKEVFDKCLELAGRIFRVLSVGLNLGKNLFGETHKYIGNKGNTTTLRSLYYPPIAQDSDIKPNQIRLGEHSDYGSLTILFQDDIGGLEVEIPGKGYVPATPIPGTAVVNIGDLMQRWTADKLIATKHRVLIPEREMKKRTSRQSMAFFVQPDDKALIECLDGSNRYEPITSLDYLNYRFSVTF